MQITFMFCKCKPPTQEYSNPNMPFPSLKFFTQKSTSMAHIFSMWPLPNSQDHFLLLPTINYPLFQTYKIPPSLSLYQYPELFTGHERCGPVPILTHTGIKPLMHYPQWPFITSSQIRPTFVITSVSFVNCLLPTFYQARS